MSHARRLLAIEKLAYEAFVCQTCHGRGGGHVTVEWADEWERVMDRCARHHESKSGLQPCKLCGKVGPPKIKIIVDCDEPESPDWDDD